MKPLHDSTPTSGRTITVAVTFIAAMRRFLPRGADGPQRYSLAEGASVADLLALIGVAADTDLTIAVDGEQAGHGTELREGASVLLLSPMEGGGGDLAELTIEHDPRREDLAALDGRLYEFNAAASGVDDGRLLAIFVREGDGTIVAGMHGWTWGGTGFVQAIWVHEKLRGHGLGSRLLAAAEAEATRRGCHQMHLDTHSYQAPEFYRRHGYEVIGELPGWPGADVRIFLRKRLG